MIFASRIRYRREGAFVFVALDVVMRVAAYLIVGIKSAFDVILAPIFDSDFMKLPLKVV